MARSFFARQAVQAQVYFVYCKAAPRRLGEKEPPSGKKRFLNLSKKINIALQPVLGAMRFPGIPLSIFSYDGTDRIRFTG